MATSPLRETPSQTAGPFLHIGLAPQIVGIPFGNSVPGGNIAPPEVAGQRISVQGVVFDGTGAPLKDLLIEVWQADANGHYPGSPDAAEGFTGWGRALADFETGIFRLDTIKPGRVMGPGGTLMAPHLNLWLVARGINIGLNTRLYFEDETEANAADYVLSQITPAARRETLIARREGDGYRFDIRLQGTLETVFFDV